jgi:hypothetical protein
MKKIFISIILILISFNFIFANLKWIEIDKKRYHIYVDIDCIDSLNCMSLISHQSFCKLNKTTNGGETWFDFYDEYLVYSEGNIYPDPQFEESFEYVDENHFFIGFEKGHIRSTRDGGKTYDTLIVHSTKDSGSYSILELDMLDTTYGVAAHAFLEVLYTKDSWSTYEVISDYYEENKDSNNQISITNVRILDSNRISYIERNILRLTNPKVLDTAILKFCYTSDRGKTWRKSLFYQGKRSGILDVDYINDSLIFMCGDINAATSGGRQIDVIYKSTDAGLTWETNYWKHPDDQEIDFGLVEMAFLDENNGIVTGQYGKVLRTTDGGETWMQDYIADDSPVLRVEYAGKQAIIGTFDGRVFLLKEDGTSVPTLNNTELLCYPNPFYESVTISFPEFMRGEAKIEIYNSVGLLIEQSDFIIGSGEMVFTPDADVPGVYFYRITHGTEIYQGNFVKME